MVAYKTYPNTFQRTEIKGNMYFDQGGNNLEINDKRITRKFSNTWKLSNVLLNDLWGKVRKEIRKYF